MGKSCLYVGVQQYVAVKNVEYMNSIWLVVEVTEYLNWGEMIMVYTFKIGWSDLISTTTCTSSFGEKQAGKVLKNSHSKRYRSSMYKYLWRTDMTKTLQDMFLIKKFLRNVAQWVS